MPPPADGQQLAIGRDGDALGPRVGDRQLVHVHAGPRVPQPKYRIGRGSQDCFAALQHSDAAEPAVVLAKRDDLFARGRLPDVDGCIAAAATRG